MNLFSFPKNSDTSTLPAYSGRANRRLPAAPPGGYAPAAPWYAWVVALLLALTAAAGIVYPKMGVAAGALILIAFVATRIVRRPLTGLLVALCVFPVYPAFRAAVVLYNLPLPTAGLRFWPQGLLCLVFGGILIGSIARRERLRVYWDDLPPVIFVLGGVYGTALSLAAQHPYFVIFGIHASLAPVFFYFAARWIRPSRHDLRRVLTFFLTAYAVLAVLSLLDYFLRPVLVLQLANAARPQMVSPPFQPLDFWRFYFRMQSLLFEENVWGSLSALVSLFCLASLSSPRPSWTIRALFCLSTLCLILTLSLGSFGCWLTGTGVLLLLRGQHRKRIFVGLALLTALGAWTYTIVGKDIRVAMLMHHIEQSGISTGDVGADRQHQWEAGLRIFEENPSGTGIGTVGYGASLTAIRLTTVADGNYISILGETGVPGILILVLTVLGTAWVLFRHLRAAQGTEKILGMTLLAYLCGMCVHAVGANPFEYYYTFPVFWMLTGIYVSRRIEAQQQAAREIYPPLPERAITTRA